MKAKIETTKSAKFNVELIDAFEADSDREDFQEIAAKWAKELCKETIEALVKNKKYIKNDVLTFSVSVSFDNNN